MARRNRQAGPALLALLAVLGCKTAPIPLAPLGPDDAPAILLFVDGLRADAVEKGVAAGELPAIRRAFFEEGARVRDAIVSLPSVTYANAVTMMTGLHPGTHGIFANTWFDREALCTRNYEDPVLSEHVNADLRAPTLFELAGGRLTSVSASPVRRGAHLTYIVDVATGGLAAALAWIFGSEEQTDTEIAGSVLALARDAAELGCWPSIAVFYFPAVDAAGHASGCDSAEYRSALLAFDLTLERFLEALRRAGVLDRALLVLTSDHGHVPTPDERSFDLHAWLSDHLGRPVWLAIDDDVASDGADRVAKYAEHELVLTVCGARQASLHARVGDAWRTRPTPAQLAGLGGGEPDFARRVAALPAVGLVAARDGDDAVLLTSASGCARIEHVQRDGESAYRYTLVAGEDPLGYDEALRGEPLSERAWLDATAGDRHPYAVPQLARCFDTHRSGDLLIFAALGWDFSPEMRGGHGGLERAELRVPLYFRGPGIARGRVVESARLVDVAPTLLDWIGADEESRAHMDGASLLDELTGARP